MKTKFWVICLLVLFASCARDINNIYTGEGEEGNKKEEIKKEDFFDYKTTTEHRLTLSYGISAAFPFYLYDEYPYELVGNTWESKQLDAVYSDFTDDNGNFSSDIVLPGYMKKVWLVTDCILVASPIEITLSEQNIIFDYQQYRSTKQAKSLAREVDRVGTVCPKGYYRLGGWDDNGKPDYLLAEPIDIPTGFWKRCFGVSKTTAPQTPTLLEVYPELKATGTNDMVLVKNTELVATYFASSPGWEDMVAYYTYQEGEEVDINNIRKTILFPRYNNKTNYLAGSQVQLKYWNVATQSYQNEFPKGTHIGWILLGNSWGLEEVTNFVRYSNMAYNSDKKQYSVLLTDPELDNHFFMVMEDNNDNRFNDVQFAITAIVPASVVPTPVIPDEVAKDEVVSYSVFGSLAYEDNWPDKGDYDMNDVVINFKGNVVKKKKSNDVVRVVRTTTTFTVVNNGANYTNGFGVQFDNLAKKSVKEVSVSRDGQIYISQFDEGADKPVLTLFDATKSVINKNISVDIRFDEWNNPVDEKDVRPPYNPFIFVNSREHEVHLPGYIPTSVANDDLRGSGNDLKKDDAGNDMYYISKDNMPFAIYISGSEFAWPDEGKAITEFYPLFEPWRKSSGEENKDWYLYPKGK
ncbi:LruC domain-containing protein [Phocaeicola sp.]